MSVEEITETEYYSFHLKKIELNKFLWKFAYLWSKDEQRTHEFDYFNLNYTNEKKDFKSSDCFKFFVYDV